MAYTTIDDPSIYFDIKNYTQSGSGNDGDDVTLTMDNCSLIWVKNRSYANGHCIFDEVRGGTKLLAANSTSAVETVGGGMTFGDSSSTIGNDSTGYGFNNRVGDNYVAWHWAGGTTSGKSTSGETITPSGYSIDATSGVGVFTWSGTGSNGTITHGLGGDVGKGMMIVKQLNSTAGWQVYHQGSGATHTWYFNSTAVPDDSDTVWNDTAPTSSVFTLGTNTGTNASGSTYVGYVFAPKQGFSKFGTYEGNGDADGTFVYTGFKPKMIICKSIDSTAGSYIIPSKTDWANGDTYWAYVYSNTTESNAAFVDFHSNGFKLRKNDDINNAETYVYMAFAEAPFVNSNGVPCTAR